MEQSIDKLLDSIGIQILSELQQDARLSYAELGRRVHLSTPAVIERVRRMEETGIITGYHASVNPEKIGLPIQAIIRMRSPERLYEQARIVLVDIPEIVECQHVTGADDFIIRALVSSVGHLEELLDRLRPYGDHTTAVVLSSPVARRPVAV